jgi:hypothetical protein
MPSISATSPRRLTATTGWIEARFRVSPRWYVAGRADRLTFSRIRSAINRLEVPWEAPITRLEAGAGFYLQRNLIARVTVQRNAREGGRVRNRTAIASQVILWF